MAYKKYIKKNGKVYGPYVYESRRVNGKVVSNYHGKENFSFDFKKYKLLSLVVVGVFLIFLSFIFFDNYLTGKAVLDIDSNYEEGQKLSGTLKLTLSQGEFIPASTNVIVKSGNRSVVFSLKNLIDDEVSVGDFNIENKNLLGRGSGYGYGDKYPIVEFILEVITEAEQEAEETINETVEQNITVGNETQEVFNETIPTLPSNETIEINQTEEIEETPLPTGMTPENGSLGVYSKGHKPQNKEGGGNKTIEVEGNVEQNITEKVIEDIVNETKSEEVVEDDTPQNTEEGGNETVEVRITGQIIGGLFKVANSFLSLTGEAILGELIEGQVSFNEPYTYNLTQAQSVKLVSSSEKVKLKIKDGKAVVTTNYKGESEKELVINLEELNIISAEGELEIKLVYSNTEIISVSKNITVEKVIEQNLTQVNITKQNITEVNVTIVNETIIEGNLTIDTIQYGAVLNLPVKWKKSVRLDEAGKVSIELPKEAMNIIVYKITESISEEVGEGDSEEEIVNDENNGSESIADNQSVKNSGLIAPDQSSEPEASEQIKSKKKEKVSKDNFIITAKVISGEISAEIELEDESIFVKFFKNILNVFTGRVVDVIETEEVTEVIIEWSPRDDSGEPNATEFEIEYETPAPVAFEEITEKGKNIVISSEVHYENILAYTQLPKEVAESNIRLYHLENNSRVLISFSSYDTNDNSLVDYIEWVVPHLSNQTYELIIEITKAEHLDSNRSFISDIYDEVKAKDDNWSEVINNNEYVRVTFETELDGSRDITLYARSVCVDGNGVIMINETEVPCDIYQKKKRIDEIRGELNE